MAKADKRPFGKSSGSSEALYKIDRSPDQITGESDNTWVGGDLPFGKR